MKKAPKYDQKLYRGVIGSLVNLTASRHGSLVYLLISYQIRGSNITIFYVNTVVICLTNNHVQHSRTKHIEIKHHFIKDFVHKGVIDVQSIDNDQQWTDIFIKPLTIKKIYQIEFEHT